jgi:predicted nucleotide-binding protein
MITKKNRGTVEIVAEAMKLGARYFLDKNSRSFFPKLGANMEEILRSKRANVFLSHGHNELLKLKLKDFLANRLGQTPIILAEQPSRGLTVVEKLERTSEMCCFAVILMTKDDQQVDGGLRARQNVIHEVGFFQGKYGRKNVVLLAERGIELFTNISGIIRIEFEQDHFEQCYEPLRIEIEASTIDATDK